MRAILWMIAGRPVISWSFFAGLGIWSALLKTFAELHSRQVPYAQRIALFGCCVLAWFLGARLAQGITVGDFFSSHQVSALWSTEGYVLYGGVLGVVGVGAVFWCFFGFKRFFLLAEFWDLGAFALGWALFWGRIGCAFYGCCYGTPAGPWPGYTLNPEYWDFQHQAFPWHLQGVKLHPTPFYEALGIFVFLWVLQRKVSVGQNQQTPVAPGVAGWLFWLLYAVLRFVLEWIRLDPRGGLLAGLSVSQWVSLGVILVSPFFLVYESRKTRVHPSGTTKCFKTLVRT
jgi:phosphatidylglycerol:prolipoprotein diacylglycerol transferase